MREYLLKSLLILAFLPLLIPASADSIIVQGEVSGQWSVDTVYVAGDIIVISGEQLLIDPGVVVIFQGPYALIVKGSVQAVTDWDAPVVFTVADTTGFSVDSIADGGWRGIRFDQLLPENDSSIFKYCYFYFGKRVAEEMPSGNGGAFYIRAFDKVRIEDCLFEHNFASFNGGAIYLDSSNVVIRDNQFLDNRCGPALDPWGYGGAICSDNARPLIWHNYFEGNSSTGTGGGIAMRFRDGIINNNEFIGNHSALGGAIAVLHIDNINYTNCNNLIVNNTADFFGGGIANLDASPKWINATIASNTSMYGGGIYSKDSVVPVYHNCIIWDNIAFSGYGNQAYFFEPYSQADFYYCDVEGGIDDFGGSGGVGGFFGAWEHTFDLDPEFRGSGPTPFQLNDGSPGVNTGDPDTTGLLLPVIDLWGCGRVCFDVIDIGPYEICLLGTGNSLVNEDGIGIHPNPVASDCRITASYEIKQVEVYDFLGKRVKKVNPGSLETVVDLTDLQPGLYLFVVMSNENRVVTEKVLKLK
jgi:predicted outer membrane repeat protein